MILALRIAFVAGALPWLLDSVRMRMFVDCYEPPVASCGRVVPWGRALALTAAIVFVAMPLAPHTD